MRSALLLLLLPVLAIAGSETPTLRPGQELQFLTRELSRAIADEFSLFEGVVTALDGTNAEAAFTEAPRLWTRNVEFFRNATTEPARSHLRKVGLGQILGLNGNTARIVQVSTDSPLAIGDRVRPSIGTVGIGILPAVGQERSQLLDLLAVRLARELEGLGRFRSEVLLEPQKRRERDDWLWRGLQYSLSLTLIEVNGQVTLLGRLQSLDQEQTFGLYSSTLQTGEGWQDFVNALRGGPPSLSHAVQHRRLRVQEPIVALALAEVDEKPFLLALGRSTVQILSWPAEELQFERLLPLPPETLEDRASRDFVGTIVRESESRLRLGHTLLRQGLALDLATDKFEATGPGLWLGRNGSDLSASYESGTNRLEDVRIDGASQGDLSGARFATWLEPGTLLIQSRDYRLWSIDRNGQERRELSRPVGSGIAFLPLPIPVLAATAPRIVDPSEASAVEGDQVTLYRLAGTRLEVLWRSDTLTGAVPVTSLAFLRGQLHLAAFEATASGGFVHLYSNLPLPEAPAR